MFLAALLAATVLPLSSELVLSALLLSGLSPFNLLCVATAGNVLGSTANYALGYWSGAWLAGKSFGISQGGFIRARHRFEKYGIFSLLFAWVPIIGDPLTFVAGALRVRFLWFLILVGVGKLFRYFLVVYVALHMT